MIFHRFKADFLFQNWLNRIRSQLSTTPPARSPVRSPGGYGGRKTHSPLGKYRKASSPSVLPRLESPDDHRGSPRLRGSKFGVVPPVHRKSNHGTPDYDSWGEESDDDEGNPPGYFMPQPYPMPAYGYPAYEPPQGAPPPVVFGFPFPAYYPPPPAYKGKGKKGKKGKVDRLDVHASNPEPGRRPKKNYPVTFSLPNGYQRSETRAYDPDRNDVLKKYKSPSHPYYNPSSHVRDDLLDDVIGGLGRDVIKSATGDMVNDYFGYSDSGRDPLESFLDRLVDDAVKASCRDVVIDTVKEMASDHMRGASALHVFDDIVDDYLDEIHTDLINDVVQDLVIEDFIEELIIEPEIDDEAPEIAREVLDKYDNKIEKREMREVSKQAGEKLMEDITLSYLLSLISRQGKVWNESDHANKFLDDVILSLVMSQYANVTTNRDKTLANKPLKKLHEKVISDVGLDLLLQQMSSSLDEDMADVDEYERGVENINSAPPTPNLLALNVKNKR
ncbi:hypothetical protein FSP39_011754 [Pinctada imbricata]|uniref:Uncharacterized protein n=1 Tax=Pinctada imbricata TaxID=66713 RepID=A0AA88YKY5_PINIB|nr:hypothetical protein FSP39_011754 [Pinctada imbricata]